MPTMPTRKFASVLLVLFLLTQLGCATVVGGRKEPVSLRSNPAGATVYVDGVAVGVAPFVMDFSHKRRHEVRFAKAGYQDQTRTMNRTFNWWFLGNLLLGGLPAVIDLAYGNQYRFDSDDINGILIPLPQGS